MSVNPSEIAYYSSMCDPAYDGASTLNGAISSTTATTFTVTNASSFPPTGEFAVQIDSEIILVTQGAGTVNWTGIRGMFGTTAATHSNGASITMPAGGPVDITAKVDFSDIVSGDTADYLSTSASDNLMIIALKGRDASGIIQTETKTLNGTTIVNGSQVWDRLLSAGLGAGTTLTNAGGIAAGATSMTVAGNSNYPSSGNFNIMMAKEIMTVTAGQGTNTWTITRGVGGTTATAHNQGDNVYLMPFGDIGVVDHTKVITSHTMQAGAANASGVTPPIANLQSGDGSTIAIGQIIVITSGTGAGQMRRITALRTDIGTNYVAVSRNWGSIPDNTSVYQVYNGMMFDLSPNPIAKVRRFLWNAASDVPGGSQRTFYEKVFAVNNDTTVALTSATVQVASDSPSLPSGALLDLATATAQNDSVTWANRQTLPGSGYGAFVTQPAATSYGANSGALAGGATPNISGSQGIALRLTLPASTTSYKGAADLRTQGNSI
jgi:hypothetical protein